MIDNSGNVFYPVTITKSIYDTDNNQKLEVTLSKKAKPSDIPTGMVGSGSGHKSGTVPDPGATAGTTKFLREDGTWSPISMGITNYFGTGTCNTAAGTVAKTVTISNFMLIKYGIVSVLFQNGIGVNNPTLNVNGTGAKPIMLNGTALADGTIPNNTTVMFQYDGTNWNMIDSPSPMTSPPFQIRVVLIMLILASPVVLSGLKQILTLHNPMDLPPVNTNMNVVSSAGEIRMDIILLLLLHLVLIIGDMILLKHLI